MMVLEDKVVRQLLELYRQGFLALILLLEQYKGRPTEWFYKQQMKQVLEMLQQLDQEVLTWIIQQLTKIYQQNYLAVYNMLRQLGQEPDINPSFAQLHTRAIEVVAMAITDSLHNAIQTVGRQINDIYRQEALKMAGKKFTAGLTWQQAKKELEQQLLSLNITGFRDRLGRNWKLGTYTAMVARTLTREVATLATINACKEFDIKLVKVSVHRGSCEMCKPIEGKIYTLDKRDKRYPFYDGQNIRIPVHPNCRHVLIPYVEELA